MISLHNSGKFSEAAMIADKKASSFFSSKDELMWRLEQGMLEFEAGNYRKSITVFDQAEALINSFQDRAQINMRKGTDEVSSVVTNPNALPYTGSFYERILLNVYKSLCYMAIGDSDGARVELRRAYQRQKDVYREFEDESESAHKEATESDVNIDAIIADVPELQDLKRVLDKNITSPSDKFTNPFSTYLSAIAYLSEGNYQEANFDFKKLFQSESGNNLFQKDYVTIASRSNNEIPHYLRNEQQHNHSMSEDVVYVIFANGTAPAKKSVNFQIILPEPIGYTGVAFPSIQYFPTSINNLSVIHDNQQSTTTQICNMSSVVSEEFKQKMTPMITRLVISYIAKETASYAFNKKMKDRGANEELLSLITTGLFKFATNTADTRCWQTLPAEYQVAHFKRPKNGIVTIKTVAGSSTKKWDVELDSDKAISIIYVRSRVGNNIDIKTFGL